MAYYIKHKFQSAKADGTNVTLVKPSNWNEDHELWMDEGTIIGRPPGSGSGPGMEIPIGSLTSSGSMVMWPGLTPPTGWFICNGQLLSTTAYPALFAILGYAYGGSGANFAVPDLRGRVPAGVDGTGRLTGSTVVNPHLLGGSGGQETEQGYADVNVTVSGRSYGQTTGAQGAHTWGNTSSINGSLGIVGGGPAVDTHSHSVDIWGDTYGALSVWADGTYSGGGGGWTRPQTNVQPTLMVNFIIKG
jgi:microcystin-dependent protein